jgi:hypothetical protein
MVQVEDLSEAMQWKVVGVPRAWVQLFWRLTNVVVCYHDTHLAPQVYMSWILYYRLYMCIEGVGPNFAL